MRKLLPILVLLCSALTSLSAQTGETVAENVTTERFTIHYKVNSTEIDSSYLNNRGQLRHILDYLENSPRIDSVTIYSWASPEGGYKRNEWLSQERGKTARRFLLDNVSDSTKLNSSKIHLSPHAENWPGLIYMVESRYERMDREKVLTILKTEGISDDTRKWRLQQLDKGRTWRYLVREYMPELRSAAWVCVWQRIALPVEHISQLAFAEPVPQPLVASAQTYQPVRYVKPLVAALRTNLLVPGFNFGAEVPVGNHWSVGADYYFPWLSRKSDNQNCFQLLGLGLEGRYWFGKNRTVNDRLEGHSLGLSTYAGYYDIERFYVGHQGEFAAVCLDYLYAMPVFNDKLHLEFNIGAGYLYSYARPYEVFEPGGKAFKEGFIKNIQWFGPLKAGVSLVVPIRARRGGAGR